MLMDGSGPPLGRRSLRWLLAGLSLTAGALAIAACGSSGSSSGSASANNAASGGSTSTSSGTTNTVAAYSGPESKYIYSWSEPKVKPGFKFSIGYLQPNGQQQTLIHEQNAAQAETKALGGTFTALDANASITTQVNQFNQLLAQHVSAIIVYPNDPKAMEPELAKAKAEGIPVIAISTPGIVTQPTLPGYATTINQAFDQAAYLTAANVAAHAPGSGFVTEGFAAPIPALEFLNARYRYWGKKLGLKFLGNVDTSADAASAYTTASSAILAKYPSVKSVFTFDTAGAQSVASLARSQGKTVWASGYGADSASVKLVKAGIMYSVGTGGFPQVGKDTVIAAYDLLTKQNLPLKKLTVAKSVLITQANAGKVPPD